MDLIFSGNDTVMIDVFKALVGNEFDMTYLGMMNYFLGLEVVQPVAGIFMSQKKYLFGDYEEVPNRGMQCSVHSCFCKFESNKGFKEEEGRSHYL